VAKYPRTWGLRGEIVVALVLSLSVSYEFKELFTSLIIPLIAINLVVNPILLSQYLKKSSITNTCRSELYGLNANKKRFIIQVPKLDSPLFSIYFLSTN
jgi:hypothetical protein